MSQRSLCCFGRPIHGPLHLLHRDENGLTYAFGYTLHKSPALARRFFNLLGCRRPSVDHLTIRLQEDSDEGITDLELDAGDVHIIVEAKKSDWPRQKQLRRYESKLAEWKGHRSRSALLAFHRFASLRLATGNLTPACC